MREGKRVEPLEDRLGTTTLHRASLSGHAPVHLLCTSWACSTAFTWAPFPAPCRLRDLGSAWSDAEAFGAILAYRLRWC